MGIVRGRFDALLIGALLALLATVSVGYLNHTGTRCGTHLITADGEAWHFAVGYKTNEQLDISFNKSTVADASTQTLTLEFCTLEDTASCDDYDFDTNGDSVGDTNILTNDPAAIETSGVRGISGFNFLRVSETGTFDATDVAAFTVCRRKV